MILEGWRANGWLRAHDATDTELREQHIAARRDLEDARADISPAWRFAIAYNAALRLCTIALAAAGYQSLRDQKHYRTIASLPHVVGEAVAELAQFLDQCRARRHQVTYEALDTVSDDEARELIEAVGELDVLLTEWLRVHRPGVVLP